jgi:exopolysaccharide biosynthesis polyprenyl glycosylphosphotransferase
MTPEPQLQTSAAKAEPESAAAATAPRVRRRPLPTLWRSFGGGQPGSPRGEAEIPEGVSTEAARSRDSTYRLLLGLADVASAGVGLLVGVQALGGGDRLTVLAFAAIPLVLLVGKVAKLYDRDEHLVKKTTLDEAPQLFRVATLYTLLIWLAGDALVRGPYFGRDQALGLWGLLFLSMLVFRGGARATARKISPEERCLVLGDHVAAGWVAHKLEACQGVKARVVGRVPLETERPLQNGLPVLGEFDTLGVVLADVEIDRVIIASQDSQSDQILDAIRLVKALGVRVSVLPRLFEVVGSSVEFDDVNGAMLLGVRRYGLTRSSAALKRALDVIGAAAGVFLLAPLIGLIALAIKLDTPGPILFRQRRMGKDNRPFEMLKFRTMVDGAEAQKAALMHRNEAGGGLFKIDGDPRITRVGALLRRTALDELPQLFNVLRGDMALVGPRPLVIDEDAQIEGWRRRRLLLPPGMTGLWQVFGSSRIPMGEMVKIDYLYGANWSLWLDIKILLRTVPFVIGRRGL